MNLTIIHDDAWDWEIAVLDGKKVAEGHSLNIHDWKQIAELLGATVDEVEVEDISQSEFYQA